MKTRLLAIVVFALLAIQFLPNKIFISDSYAQATPNVYVGIDIAYGATQEAKLAIDKVSSYTNLVVFGSTQVTWFQDRVNETFQYAYDRGLSIISLRPALPQYTTEGLNETEWYSMAQNRWGERLLGFYILDEPGGKQLDGTAEYGWNNFTGYPSSYVNAANMFTEGVSNFLGYERPPAYYETFTSDYALYWYDYKAGYDTVFAQFGWNYSREINIALCRGAAEKQNKDWGVIITWTYTNPPFLESGEQLYNDMLLAYDNGAKYIIVFDSDENGHSTLQAEHYDAMQRFWNYAQNNPPKIIPKNQRTAFVLPDAYGFGFRWPKDHIWGVWEADELTGNISLSVGTLLKQYGARLDILYNDGLQEGSNGYNQLIYWNSYDPTPTPSPTLSPTPSPTPTPTASPDNPLTEFSLTALLITTIIVSTAFS
ncbi:MAG: hypothetical protein NWE95_13015 [Candidatus Bathyarchaeota archaeon]|nr:hypothetical protein [Candidatus Bathyarchaeota archaeon]